MKLLGMKYWVSLLVVLTWFACTPALVRLYAGLYHPDRYYEMRGVGESVGYRQYITSF